MARHYCISKWILGRFLKRVAEAALSIRNTILKSFGGSIFVIKSTSSKEDRSFAHMTNIAYNKLQAKFNSSLRKFQFSHDQFQCTDYFNFQVSVICGNHNIMQFIVRTWSAFRSRGSSSVSGRRSVRTSRWPFVERAQKTPEYELERVARERRRRARAPSVRPRRPGPLPANPSADSVVDVNVDVEVELDAEVGADVVADLLE